MTSPVDLGPTEQVLEKARATYYVSRMLVQSGELYLTNLRLLFTPTSALDLAIGASTVDIRLDDVQQIHCEGETTRKVTVRTAVRTCRFVGRNFDALVTRLEELAPARGTGGDREHVLASAKVNVYVSRMVTQSGVLYLTDQRLSFVPVGVLDRVMGARELSVALGDIETVGVVGTLDRRTYIRTRGPVLALVGVLPPPFLTKLREALARHGVRI